MQTGGGGVVGAGDEMMGGGLAEQEKQRRRRWRRQRSASSGGTYGRKKRERFHEKVTILPFRIGVNERSGWIVFCCYTYILRHIASAGRAKPGRG